MTDGQITQFKNGLQQHYPKYSPEESGPNNRAWDRLLSKISFKAAGEALEELLSDSNKKIYGIPTPGDLKPYLKSVNAFTNCPCCNNSRFLVWWKSDRGIDVNPAYRCKCSTSNIKYEKDGLYICNNINCQNPQGKNRLFVPPGWGKRMRFLMAGCKHVPSITESKDFAKHDGHETGLTTQKIIRNGLQTENEGREIPF
jgi:hypothetical protein